MTNQDLLAIAKEFGTPVYVYDVNSIREQYEKLTSSFSKNTRFFYAAKALTNINILKYVEKLGASLDCVSINEVKLGLKAGFTNDRILFTPNCVDLAEIEEAMSLNVHINIDNISILEQFGNKFGGSYPIFVRINPHIFAGGNYKISTGHIDSKFGISIHQLRHIERVMKSTNINVEGLHMHTGSEIKDPDVFLQGLDIMFELAEHFPNL
ncbi:MAG: diaminopimelate decarboxylase, partial [Chryseobacterium sp.]|nr:diaminopimelate decarboxylase [Chryseobacterium sp.]